MCINRTRKRGTGALPKSMAAERLCPVEALAQTSGHQAAMVEARTASMFGEKNISKLHI